MQGKKKQTKIHISKRASTCKQNVVTYNSECVLRSALGCKYVYMKKELKKQS